MDLANLELSDAVLAGSVLATAVWDAPDWYYRMALPEQVRGAFTFEGVAASTFYAEAVERGLSMAPPDPGQGCVCLSGHPMGWSGGAFIAHSLTQYCIEECLPSCTAQNRVVEGLPAPLMGKEEVVHWEYIDDYGLPTLEERVDPVEARKAQPARATVLAG